LVWTLPSGVIAYGGLFGDITIVEPGEVEHRAGLIAARRRRSDLGRATDSSVAMWVTALDYVV
jgi:hypothetical protein